MRELNSEGIHENRIKLSILIKIRWIAIIGQLATILVVYFLFNFEFPFFYCCLLVLISAFLNIILQVKSKKTDLLTNTQATWNIFFDLIQLFCLLFLTGGITNPFSILIAAPITIASGFLSLRSTVSIGIASVILIVFLSFFYLKLPGLIQINFFPNFYIGGLTLALCTAIIFFAVYLQGIKTENIRRSRAINELEQTFLREKELKSLSGFAAAAAHEFATPLNTISLVAKELKKDTSLYSKFNADIDLLVSQTQRCSEILKQITSDPYKQDLFLENASCKLIVEEIKNASQFLNKKIFFLDISNYNKDYLLKKKIELIYGIKNLIDNAFKFCLTTVKVSIRSTESYLQIVIEDDGPGFSSEIKNILGDPYIKSKSGLISKNQGLGLGFFISKTFLERLEAKINFYNNKKSGAVVDIFWSYSDLKQAELI